MIQCAAQAEKPGQSPATARVHAEYVGPSSVILELCTRDRVKLDLE